MNDATQLGENLLRDNSIHDMRMREGARKYEYKMPGSLGKWAWGISYLLVFL